jgi:membrane protease YdiL (CAAX protease family)
MKMSKRKLMENYKLLPIEHKFHEMVFVKRILLLYLFNFVIVLAFVFIYTAITSPVNEPKLTNNSIQELNMTTQIILYGLVVPIVESVLFQGLIISGLNKISIVSNRWIGITISATLFSGLHYQSLLNIISTIPSAIILAILYDGLMRKKKKPLLNVVTLHVLNNLMAILL